MRSFLLLIVCLMSTGCATIMTGGGHTQNVRFASTPPGATVYVDDNQIGKTPVAAQLTRHDDHKVRMELAGYETKTMMIKNGPNLWTIGNVVFGGIIGIVVDAVSGSWEGVLNPNDVQVKFDKPSTYTPYYSPYSSSPPSYNDDRYHP